MLSEMEWLLLVWLIVATPVAAFLGVLISNKTINRREARDRARDLAEIRDLLNHLREEDRKRDEVALSDKPTTEQLRDRPPSLSDGWDRGLHDE